MRIAHRDITRGKPIMVLGAGGMLATAIVDLLEEKKLKYVALPESDLDITSKIRTALLIKELDPGVVINTAAYTDVEGAESNRELAFAINGEGAGNVAIAAADIGATVVHISTDYVFNGSKGSPYVPGDPVDPLNVYGASKLEGEHQVKAGNNKHLIVRTAGMFGPNGKNFATTMMDMGRRLDLIKVVEDQVVSPTFTRHLASGILGLIDCGAEGTLHLASKGQCSWYEFAVEIFRKMDMEVHVSPISTDEYPALAKRPLYSVLDSSLSNRSLGEPLPSWKLALDEFLKELRRASQQTVSPSSVQKYPR